MTDFYVRYYFEENHYISIHVEAETLDEAKTMALKSLNSWKETHDEKTIYINGENVTYIDIMSKYNQPI